MPYASMAQARKFHAMEARGEIPHKTVAEYDRASRGHMGDLPEKVHKAGGGPVTCPKCSHYFYAEGGEIPDDYGLGKKRDAELPEAHLDVYRGENAKREDEERERRERFERERDGDGEVTASRYAGGGEVPRYGEVTDSYEDDRAEMRREADALDRYSRRREKGAEGRYDDLAAHLVRRRAMRRGGLVPRR